MTYKVTSFEIKIKKGKVARLEYVTLKTGLSWQDAKKIRASLRKAFIVPEVIHEHQDRA